jgi:chaperonin GroES
MLLAVFLMILTSLQKNILSVLALYHAQRYPLTLLELWRLRLPEENVTSSFAAFRVSLEELVEANLISHHQGFYFFPGNSNFVEERQQRYTYSLRLLYRLTWKLKLLAAIPFVRSVALSGSSARMHMGRESDIDLFVIVARGRIWIVRLFMTVLAQLLGVRRHGDAIAGRVCLNHYIVEGGAVRQDRNLYTAHLYAWLLPLAESSSVAIFQQKNLGWMRAYFAEMLNCESSFFGSLPRILRWCKRIGEALLSDGIGNVFEDMARALQRPRIETSATVLVSDEEIALHPQNPGFRGSKGREILFAYEEYRTSFLTRGRQPSYNTSLEALAPVGAREGNDSNTTISNHDGTFSYSFRTTSERGESKNEHMTHKIKPLGDRILVKQFTEEEVTASGIVLPDTAEKEKKAQGKIIAVGNGQEIAKLGLKEGDVVIFGKYSGEEVEMMEQGKKEEYKILYVGREEDKGEVLAIVEK